MPNLPPTEAGPLTSHRGEKSAAESKNPGHLKSALEDVRAAINPILVRTVRIPLGTSPERRPATTPNPILQRLAAIAEDVDPDERPPTRRAEAALLEVIDFLLEARSFLDIEAPLPHLSSLGGGDLECAWMRSERNLFLSIGPSGERVLQRVHLNNAEAKTLKRIESPDKIALLDAVLWVMGHGEAE